MFVNFRFTIFNTGILQINGVATHDAGNYRCVAVNDEHNQSSAEATLNVIPGMLRNYCMRNTVITSQ